MLINLLTKLIVKITAKTLNDLIVVFSNLKSPPTVVLIEIEVTLAYKILIFISKKINLKIIKSLILIL